MSAPEPPVLVLAQSYRHAEHWAREQGLPSRSAFKYVQDERDLRGVRGWPYAVLDTFWRHPRAGVLHDRLQASGAVPRED